MDKMADKLLLLGFGVFLLFAAGETEQSVVTLLEAVIAAALSIYIEEKRSFYVLFAAFFLVSLLNPEILLFFPVVLYDMVYCRSYIPAVPFLLLFLQNLPQDPKHISFWLITMALSAVLAYKTAKNERISGELIRIRDDGMERNLMLKEKNRHLLEKQDYEIHLATLKERNRIAREIHDNVGHMLSRSILMTGALLTTEKEGAVHNQLLHMKDTLDEAMTSIRKSVHDLHDDSIVLEQSVREILEPMQEEYEVKLEYDMSENIPRRVKYCLIATTKEAVSNILKHSSGNKVQISFREHPGFYRLSIEDNGTDIKIRQGSGIGLQNMKERSDALGGTFRIHTEKGFGIFMTIPKTEEILCG